MKNGALLCAPGPLTTKFTRLPEGLWWNLHWAAKGGDVQEVEHILDSLLGELHHATLVYSWTPLATAAIYNQVAVAEALISRGAVLDHQDSNRSTPLHEAAFWANSAMVECLLRHGADPFLADAFGRLPIQVTPRSALGIRSSLQVSQETGSEVPRVITLDRYEDLTGMFGIFISDDRR